MQNLILFLGVYGKRIGFALLLAPTVWDLLWFGARDAENIKICLPGVVVMWIGAGLIYLARKIDREVTKKK